MQSALQALSNIGSGNALVAAASGGWAVRFAGTLAGQVQAPVTGNGAGHFRRHKADLGEFRTLQNFLVHLLVARLVPAVAAGRIHQRAVANILSAIMRLPIRESFSAETK